jgi:8-oxo-dGTP pyrophosphatase MutT (NUDIX family)
MRQGAARHLATPRTLVFLRRHGRRLFLEGGPRKWFAGQLNGVGGSVEAGEDVLAAALREATEETGLAPVSLELAAVVHVMAEPVVMLFVFTGTLPEGKLVESDEGRLLWLTDDELRFAKARLVPDLVDLLPRLDARRPGDPPLFLVTRPDDRTPPAGAAS